MCKDIKMSGFFQVDLTIHGKEMMKNFLYDICGLSGTFTIKDRETKCLEEIVEQVGENKVLVSFKFSLVTSFCRRKCS